MDHLDWKTTGALGDRYVLRSRVGSGRTTTVYVADDVRLERQVALKLFHDLPGEDGFTRFATEAQVLAGLSHPGLVTVYDVNLATDRPYLVMRLIDGGPLSALLDEGEGDLEPASVAQFGAHLADVLAYVHERGVVHGDINAGNVLVDAQGAGHLTGFGADDGFDGPPGDVYALGVTLAECVPPGLGPEWYTVLGLMTDPDPGERPDAARCGELLRNLASGDTADIPLPRAEESVLAELPAEPAAAAPKPARRRAAYAGLAGMGLAIGALAVVAATTSSGTPDEPAGEQGDRKVEQPAESQVSVPGQSYPQAPAQRRAPNSAKSEPGKPSSSATSARPAPPPPPRGPGGDDGPGNGPGNGDNNGNGRHKGLLGSILDGLG